MYVKKHVLNFTYLDTQEHLNQWIYFILPLAYRSTVLSKDTAAELGISSDSRALSVRFPNTDWKKTHGALQSQ